MNFPSLISHEINSYPSLMAQHLHAPNPPLKKERNPQEDPIYCKISSSFQWLIAFRHFFPGRRDKCHCCPTRCMSALFVWLLRRTTPRGKSTSQEKDKLFGGGRIRCGFLFVGNRYWMLDGWHGVPPLSGRSFVTTSWEPRPLLLIPPRTKPFGKIWWFEWFGGLYYIQGV